VQAAKEAMESAQAQDTSRAAELEAQRAAGEALRAQVRVRVRVRVRA